MVQCADKTFYTGVTTDMQRRLTEHNGQTTAADCKGAKYTKARRPVVLVYQEEIEGRGAAQRREASLRRLSRIEKLALISLHSK